MSRVCQRKREGQILSIREKRTEKWIGFEMRKVLVLTMWTNFQDWAVTIFQIVSKDLRRGYPTELIRTFSSKWSSSVERTRGINLIILFFIWPQHFFTYFNFKHHIYIYIINTNGVRYCCRLRGGAGGVSLKPPRIHGLYVCACVNNKREEHFGDIWHKLCMLLYSFR